MILDFHDLSQVISEEVTVPLGLCLFTFAIASLVGPLAVSDQYHLKVSQRGFRLAKVGAIYDTYGTYRTGFLGVGTLGVLGALILAAITIALPPRKNEI